jgi:hypothetical protein
MAEENTLTNYDMITVTAVKSFMVQAPGVGVIKIFFLCHRKLVRNKLECFSQV